MFFKKRSGRDIPREFRRKRGVAEILGLNSWFRKRERHDGLPQRRFNLNTLLGLPVAKAHRKSDAPLPSEFRKPPFYRRLPESGRYAIMGAWRSLVFLARIGRGALRLPASVWMTFCLLAGIGTAVVGFKLYRNASDVILRVGNTDLTSKDYYHRLQLTAGPAMLTEMMAEEEMLQFAAKQKALPAPSAVEERARQIMAAPGVSASMKAHNMNAEDIRRQARLQLASERLFGGALDASEDEIQEYYRANTDLNNLHARFYRPEFTQVSVIVCKQENEARAADAALHRGESFAQTALKYSIASSRDRGGEDTIVRGRSPAARIPGMENAIFALAPGQRLGPQKFMGVWWIIACRSKSPSQTQSLQEVHDICLNDLRVARGMKLNGGQVVHDLIAFEQSLPLVVFAPEYYKDATDQIKQVRIVTGR